MDVTVFIPEHDTFATAQVTSVDGYIHIFCPVQQPEGHICPSKNQHLFIKNLHEQCFDHKKPDDLKFVMQRGHLYSQIQCTTTETGIIHDVYIGNRALGDDFVAVFKTAEPADSMDDDRIRCANMMPVRVYPEKCDLAQEKYVYWALPYANSSASPDILWVDADRFAQVWRETTNHVSNAVEHFETDRDNAIKYGDILLKSTPATAHGMAEIVCHTRDKGGITHAVFFTNGRHRMANAHALGCVSVPVKIEQRDGQSDLKNIAGSRHHYNGINHLPLYRDTLKENAPAPIRQEGIVRKMLGLFKPR